MTCLPDIVNHRGLQDTEEPVLLGVLWPFLHFSPGRGWWRERGKQVTWLQDNVLIILPAVRMKGLYQRLHSWTIPTKRRWLLGSGTVHSTKPVRVGLWDLNS